MKFNNIKSIGRPAIYRKARVLRFNNQNRYSFSNSTIFLARHKFNNHRLNRAPVKLEDLIRFLDNNENEMISILFSILSQSSFLQEILLIDYYSRFLSFFFSFLNLNKNTQLIVFLVYKYVNILKESCKFVLNHFSLIILIRLQKS